MSSLTPRVRAGAVSYDPSIIQVFADALYAKARSILVTYTVLGALAGGVAGYSAGTSVRSSNSMLFGALGLVLVGAIAFSIARAKAFLLKLQAQSALCQVQIEENGRR